VTHGVTLRAIVMMWLHQTPEWFEAVCDSLESLLQLHRVQARPRTYAQARLHILIAAQEPNPGNGSIRLIDHDVDKGYIFEGFDDIPPPRPAQTTSPTAQHTSSASLAPHAPVYHSISSRHAPFVNRTFNTVDSLRESMDQVRSSFLLYQICYCRCSALFFFFLLLLFFGKWCNNTG
jgi:hypothetical protein